MGVMVRTSASMRHSEAFVYIKFICCYGNKKNEVSG